MTESRWAAPIAWYSVPGDSLVRREELRHESEATREAMNIGVPSAAQAPDGSFAFRVVDYTLARYTSDGEFIEEFTSPAYEPEMPTERDVEARAASLEDIIGRPPSEASTERYRERPVMPTIRERPLRFDSAGRLWVATTRDHEERSYFDLFREGDYLGSVSVRDRVVGYDILDSTLAVLVERQEPDSVGLYPRHVDWYRITEPS
jgi:hypothetical protein